MLEFVATILVPSAKDLGEASGWQQGPLPLTVPGRFTTDAATRATYFDRRAAGVLYGQRRRCRRLYREFADGHAQVVASGSGDESDVPASTSSTILHLVDNTLTDQAEILALEWLGLPDNGQCAGVLVVHVRVSAATGEDLLRAWSGLVRWKFDERGTPVLLRSVSRLLGTTVVTLGTHDEPFRVAFLAAMPAESPAPVLPPGQDVHPRGVEGGPRGEPDRHGAGSDADDDPATRSGSAPAGRTSAATWWAFNLASAVPPGSLSPSERQFADHERHRLSWSSDWSALVLRDGAAFVGHASVDPGFLEVSAPTYARTVYTDALLLGLLQQLGLRDLTDRLAHLEDPARHPRAVERLDAEFSRFRNALWWQHLTHHGPGNELLLEYQRQHRLQDLMEQTRSELEDYSRQAGLRSARVLNLVVTCFAGIGVLGVLIDLFQLYGPPPATPSPQLLGWSSATFLLLLVLVITTTLGGLSWLRPHRRPYQPRSWRREPAAHQPRRRAAGPRAGKSAQPHSERGAERP